MDCGGCGAVLWCWRGLGIKYVCVFMWLQLAGGENLNFKIGGICILADVGFVGCSWMAAGGAAFL